MPQIKFKRGLAASVAAAAAAAGEPLLATDRSTLFIGHDDGTGTITNVPLTPAIDKLEVLDAGVLFSQSSLMIHDSNATGQKERKITFPAFRSALQIPPDKDEMVMLNAGSDSGYLYGSGTDGVLAMGDGLSWSIEMGPVGKDQAVISLTDIDGGTF